MWLGQTIYQVMETVQVREMMVFWVDGEGREQLIRVNCLGERTNSMCI